MRDQAWLFDGDEPVRPARSSDDRFELFWQAYPSARRINKAQARKVFARVVTADEDFVALLHALDVQRVSPQWTEHPRFIPHPTTYLNQRRWTDDLGAYAPQPPTAAEMAYATRVRQAARSGCPHDAPCGDWRACVNAIVRDYRGRASGPRGNVL